MGEDRSSRSGQKEEKEHRNRDEERSKSSGGLREKKNSDKDGNSVRHARKDDRDEREKDKQTKDRSKDAGREKYRESSKDKERKDRESEHRRDRKHGKDVELERDKEREREKSRGKEKDRDKERDRKKDREPEIHKERDRKKDREPEIHKEKEKVVREYGRDRGKDYTERERVKERHREDEMEVDPQVIREGSYTRSEDPDEHGLSKPEGDYSRDSHHLIEPIGDFENEPEEDGADTSIRKSNSEIEERIQKMKQERLAKNSSESASEVLSWVSKSRKLEERMKAEKEKAIRLSKNFEEQDNIDDDSDEDAERTNLDGVRVLHHGLEKVVEGGAIVLTLKDQSILADGDVNEETDVLENVEIVQQKQRNDAYKAAKAKKSLYDDKFNDETGSEKKMLPQYDDPAADEFVTLDSTGHFSGEAEKKLEELRKRIQGASAIRRAEDLSSAAKKSSDYYTEEEMIAKFKKPKKKKSLRKKEKLDLDALEAEAIVSGLGTSDLGARDDVARQSLREEEDRIQAEMKREAYQSAYAKADEASKALRLVQTKTKEEDDDGDDDAPAFADDDELQKSLQRARKIALEKKEKDEKLQLINLLSATASKSVAVDSGDQSENKVVFTEMEEFVWGLQLDEEENKPKVADVFMEEDEKPITAIDVMEVEDGALMEVAETADETLAEDKEEVVPDETIHEAAVGKGLAGALKLLKDRGTLKETVEWGGRNMDKKKSKLSEIHDNNEVREIRIERTDEYGRTMTPKESFRQLSHKFHGKGPGKMKQEKRMRQYQEELKVKRMKNADTPSLSVERMREAQAKLQTPYLVLSGNAKPGQSNDPRSMDDFTGGMTPMLGDKKVEHFLNMTR